MYQKRRERSSGTSRRRPTLKQKKFALAYGDPKAANGNGTTAARIAGYKGNDRQLAVQACVNLKNANVQRTIAAMLDAIAEPALQSLAEAMEATSVRPFLSKEGEVVYAQPQPDHKVRLEAVRLVFELRAAFSETQAPPPGGPEHNHIRHLEPAKESAQVPYGVREMSPADRMAFREAGEIEQQMAEIDDEDHEESK